jgi:hypothetical protein
LEVATHQAKKKGGKPQSKGSVEKQRMVDLLADCTSVRLPLCVAGNDGALRAGMSRCAS